MCSKVIYLKMMLHLQGRMSNKDVEGEQWRKWKIKESDRKYCCNISCLNTRDRISSHFCSFENRHRIKWFISASRDENITFCIEHIWGNMTVMRWYLIFDDFTTEKLANGWTIFLLFQLKANWDPSAVWVVKMPICKYTCVNTGKACYLKKTNRWWYRPFSEIRS